MRNLVFHDTNLEVPKMWIMKRALPVVPALAVLALLNPPAAAADETPPSPEAAPAASVEVDPECEPSDMPLEGRASPYDSASVSVGDAVLKICYGRPSARGRTMIGGEHVPFGQLWRTGANEPTTLHVTAPVSLGGIHLDPGSYAVYTIPGDEDWEIFVSRSTDHWGLQIDEDVRDQEVGSVTVPRERPDEHVETFTISFTPPTAQGTEVIMEWEDFRVRLPVEVHGG